MIATAKVGIRWFVGCDIGERNVKMAWERFAHEVTAKCRHGHLSEIYGAEVERLGDWFSFLTTWMEPSVSCPRPQAL